MLAAKPFGGQTADEPVHDSATSHGPADARQTNDVVAKPSGGQSGEEPVQLSATSQSPADERQTTVFEAN